MSHEHEQPADPVAASGTARGAVAGRDTPPASIGSRVFSVVLAFVVGSVYAAIGTVVHAVTVGVIPIPLIVTFIGMIALLIGFRLLLDDRLVVLGAGVGIVLTIVLFALQSPGGSVLISDGPIDLIWMLVPVLIATVAVTWPRIPQRSRPIQPDDGQDAAARDAPSVVRPTGADGAAHRNTGDGTPGRA